MSLPVYAKGRMTTCYVCGEDWAERQLQKQKGRLVCKRCVDRVVIRKTSPEARTQSGNQQTQANPMVNILSRETFFVAVGGQTVFPLTPTVVKILGVFKFGVRQSVYAGDFTVSGNTVVMTNPSDAGDKISIVYQYE